MRLRNVFSIVIPFILVTACSSTDQSVNAQEEITNLDVPVVGGSPDRGRHPAVVALMLGNEGLCTGTLIAPDAVLTARHCVSITSESVQCPSIYPQVIRNRDPASIAILVGEKLSTAQEIARGRQVDVLPYDDLCGKDIAVIRLDRAIFSIRPASLRMKPVMSGERIDLVGFGRRGDYSSVGEKYCRKSVKAIDATSREFLTAESSCSGDSGGPALDNRTGEIVGIVSRGGPSCEGPEARSIYTQVSAFPELLSGFVEADNQQDAGIQHCGTGIRCPKGTHCGSDHVCHPTN